jgi:deazaflavin-dependent oxidoreductase (nitroreductase family)
MRMTGCFRRNSCGLHHYVTGRHAYWTYAAGSTTYGRSAQINVLRMGERHDEAASRTRMWRFRRIATRHLNPIIRPVAGRLPGLGVVTHTGRTTGRTYRSPITVFRRGSSYIFFLTYGSDAHWVKNILAAGSCSLETRGRVVNLVEPVVVTDPELRPAPAVVRLIEGRIAGVTQYLRMHAEGPT